MSVNARVLVATPRPTRTVGRLVDHFALTASANRSALNQAPAPPSLQPLRPASWAYWQWIFTLAGSSNRYTPQCYSGPLVRRRQARSGVCGGVRLPGGGGVLAVWQATARKATTVTTITAQHGNPSEITPVPFARRTVALSISSASSKGASYG